VLPDHSIFVPNAFTPNGDGNNDYFEIFGNLFAINTLNVKVFDRLGNKVFESNEIHFKWDGTYKDKILTPAVFVYVVKASLYKPTPAPPGRE
jgi:gliding motility-associated-like protein